MNPKQIISWLKALKMTNGQILFAYAKAMQGQNLCGSTPIIDGCATTINNVFAGAFGAPIGGGASTAEMYAVLRSDPRFINVNLPMLGDIIISPTGLGNGDIPNGHVGIVSDNQNIMSNNSATGIFDEHLNDIVWYQRFSTQGGYPVLYFRVC